MLVLVGVERAGLPPPVEAHGEQHDHRADEALRGPPVAVGQHGRHEHERQPEHEQRRGVPGTPGEPQGARGARTPVALRGDDGGDGDEVIRVGRVPEAEQHGDRQHDHGAAPAAEPGDQLVETEHSAG